MTSFQSSPLHNQPLHKFWKLLATLQENKFFSQYLGPSAEVKFIQTDFKMQSQVTFNHHIKNEKKRFRSNKTQGNVKGAFHKSAKQGSLPWI